MTAISEEYKSIAGNSIEPGKLSFVALLFLLASIAFVAIGFNEFQQEAANRNWSSVKGRILSSQVVNEKVQRASAFSGHQRTSDRYRARATYEFTVGGESFRGEQISHDDLGYPLYDQAAEIVARYPAGRVVSVSYQPDDPANAVLDNRSGTAVSTPLFFGVTLFLCSGVMAVVARVEQKRNSQNISAASLAFLLVAFLIPPALPVVTNYGG